LDKDKSSVKNEQGQVIEIMRRRTKLDWMLKGTSDKLTFELRSEFPRRTSPAKSWDRKEGVRLQEVAAKALERSEIEERYGWTRGWSEVKQGQGKTFAFYPKGKWQVTGVFQEGHHMTWCMSLEAHLVCAGKTHSGYRWSWECKREHSLQLAGAQETLDATLLSENIILDKQLNFHLHEAVFWQTKG